ncbi:MAG: nitroreductase family protein [Bacteroidota bacterium]
MTDVLLKHRSIRKYKSDAIETDLLHRILQAGIRASTTGNMQLYSIIVNRDPEMKEALAPLHFNQAAIRQAPVVMTFCADFNRFNTWCRLRKAEPGYDNFLSFFTAAIDALLVAQNICVAAESEGLGICYFGTTTYTADRIIEVLKLPKGVVPVTTITMGYPDEEPAQTDRLPLSAVVHREVYKDYTEEAITEFYGGKESDPVNRRFIEENGKETLAQVFTDVRYTRKDNLAFSRVLLSVLEKQGFMNNFE